jgi:transcriptional regulator GlxA family with amidase domain
VLVYEGAQALDTAGPCEVFASGNVLAGGEAYRVRVVSLDGADVVSSTGLRIGVHGRIEDLNGPIDTLVVPGSWGWATAMHDAPLLAALAAAAARSRRVAAVCTGAFLLGATGMLDGRHATTHWQFVDELAARFPAALVERDPIFVGDGEVYTSAGVTAGIDLALALLEADHGPEIARGIARYLVVFMQRPGGQSQFSVRMQAEPRPRSPLRALLDAITTDPAADHRLAALSARSGFSERHLTRVFVRELGATPARWVEQVRVEAARALLESSDLPLDAVARRAGLGSVESLRRSFTREVGTSPHAYRQRFRTTGVRLAVPG